MTTHKEALALTLAALKQIDAAMPFPVAKLAIKKAEKALAQPEQEPVAWVNLSEDQYQNICERYKPSHGGWVNSLVLEIEGYLRKNNTTPPQRTWVGLTDEERKNIMIACESTGDWAWELNAAKAIEAKLKEKNT